MNAGCVTSLIHKPVVDPAIKLKGLGKKHEIYAAAFGGHVLMTYFTGSGSQGAMTSLLPLDPLLLTMTTWCTGCGNRMSHFSYSHIVNTRCTGCGTRMSHFSDSHIVNTGCTGCGPRMLACLINTVNTLCTGCEHRMSHISYNHSDYMVYRVWTQDVLTSLILT